MINLYDIKDPSFLRDMSIKELKELAEQIREFLIENVSKTGGHLSSNLGVVELSIAMHYVFCDSNDEMLFDVGHQSYVHKILTGRAKEFSSLRQYGGMSGFIKKTESSYDIWESGHSSSTISAASGLNVSNEAKRQIVLIGDSSISNGVAMEGLNYLGQIKNGNSPIIILNDNKMGISKSVGAMSKTLLRLRSTRFFRGFKGILNKIFPGFINRLGHRIKRSIKGFIQRDNIFEDLGFDYYGPYNGHDMKILINLFKRIRNNNGPVLVHVITQKGKGYKYAEEDMEGFHGVGPFDINTGKPLCVDNSKVSYSKAVADFLCYKREKEEFFVVTPAMKTGEKLDTFAEKYKSSFIDVGIAEEHATLMCAGMALHNKRSVLLMYSTFSQRSYDYFLNDIARQDLPVIIGIDRSGIVPGDGETHQGIYDISMFMAMPNVNIFMAKDQQELVELFNLAFTINHPVVIRYPKLLEEKREIDYDLVANLDWVELTYGKDIAIISYGTDVKRIFDIVKNNNIDATVINARIIKPLDNDMLNKVFNSFNKILVVEQAISSGSLYHKILEYKEENNFTSKVINHSLKVSDIIPTGSLNDLYDIYGLSDEKLKEFILNNINK